MEDLREAHGTFAINLLKMLSEEDNLRNVFLSPLSLSSALAMVLLGAKGNTEAQMSQVCMPIAKEDQGHASSVLPQSWPFHTSHQLMRLGAGRGHSGDGEKADMGRKVNCLRQNLLLVFLGETSLYVVFCILDK